MDIIDFVQDVCGWQLSEWQIKFTRTAYAFCDSHMSRYITSAVRVGGGK